MGEQPPCWPAIAADSNQEIRQVGLSFQLPFYCWASLVYCYEHLPSSLALLSRKLVQNAKVIAFS
jgi:hypothetical protein